MEQKDYIKLNVDALAITTKCTRGLLLPLYEQNILSKAEFDNLLVPQLSGNEGSATLYNTIHSRHGAYDALLQSLRGDGQTNAYAILLQNINQLKIHTKCKKFINENETIAHFINSRKNYLILSTVDCNLTVEKVSPVKDINMPEIEEREFRPYSSLCDLFCFFEKSRRGLVSGIRISGIRRMLQPINHNRNNKLILVTDESVDKIKEHLDGHFVAYKNSVCIVEDELTWSNLTNEYKEILLNRIVYDKGHIKTLREFCSKFHSIHESEVKNKFIKGNILIDIINLKVPLIWKHSVPVVKFYIPRKIISRNTIRSDIFRMPRESTILLRSAAERHELCDKLDNFQFSSSQIHQGRLTVKNIVQDKVSGTECAFDKICRLATSQHVHLLDEINPFKKIKWVESRAGLEYIQNYIANTDAQDVYNENEFLKLIYTNWSYRVIPISGLPGMGKTLLLSKLANRLRNKYPTRLVLFIVLPEFIRLVRESTHEKDKEQIKNVILLTLAGYASAYPTKEILMLNDTNEHGLELLFDGLDEVANEEEVEFALNCLKYILRALKSCRMFITTRPHLLEKVEKTFVMLGFNIKEFEYEDQIELLISQWAQERLVANLEIDKTRLHKLAVKCLKKFRVTLNTTDFAGVPLLCLLIGRYFKPEVFKYADPAYQPTNYKIPSLLFYEESFIKLYEAFVKVKGNKNELVRMQNLYRYYAITLIFQKCDWSKLEWFKMFTVTDQDVKDLLKIGLMVSLHSESDREKLQFIHRTFAEYFVADFAIKIMKYKFKGPAIAFLFGRILQTEEQTADTSTYIKHCQITFKYPIVCHFIDTWLEQNAPSVSSLFTKEQQITIRKYHQGSCKSICHACVRANFQHLFFLTRQLVQLTINDYRSMLETAAERSSLEFFKKVLNLYEPLLNSNRVNGFKLGHLRDSLHAAARGGNLDVVSCLLRLVNQKLNKKDMFELLVACVYGSFEDDQRTIDNKIQIVNLLANRCKEALSHKDNKGKTLLHLKFVHVELLITLVNMGTEVTLPNRQLDTVAHTAAEYLSSNDYHKLLTHILSKRESNKQILRLSGEFGFTPLHSMLFYSKPSVETLEMFYTYGADFNQFCDLKYSALGVAIWCEQNVVCLANLIKYGAETDKVDEWGNSALHLAAKVGGCQTVEYFLKLFKDTNNSNIDILLNKYGNTPLYHSLWNDKEIMQLLINLGGADVRAVVNDKGETLLHHAVQFLDVNMIAFILQRGLRINARDKQGNTVLYHALKRNTGNTYEVVKFLVEKKVDVNATNAEGLNAVEAAQEGENWHPEPEALAPLAVKGNPRLVSLIAKYTREYFSENAAVKTTMKLKNQNENDIGCEA